VESTPFLAFKDNPWFQHVPLSLIFKVKRPGDDAMDPRQRQKIVKRIWLGVFAGIFCLMVCGIYKIPVAIAVGLEIIQLGAPN